MDLQKYQLVCVNFQKKLYSFEDFQYSFFFSN